MSIGLSSAAICLTDRNSVQHSVLGCVVHNFFSKVESQEY